MNILLLSWRLPSHPRSGGAELLTQRIAERLNEFGHTVTWAGGGDANASAHGVHQISLGSQLQSIVRARRFYSALDKKPDVVIEQINTLPFFARAYVRQPVITWFNQLARSIWWYEAPFPFNALGYMAEPIYLGYYRNADVVTISRSSADDLRRHGVGKQITILPMASDASAIPELNRKPQGSLRLAFVGRIVPSKRVGDALQALAILRQTFDARLDVMGSGEPRALKHARELALRLGVAPFVEFHGFVSPQERQRLLAQSHLLVVPSSKEGWGLVVGEANSAGTPAVAYDVDGLRDSVVDRETGWLCRPDYNALAQTVRAAMDDAGVYEAIRRRAWERVRELDWNATALALERVLNDAIARENALSQQQDDRLSATKRPTPE